MLYHPELIIYLWLLPVSVLIVLPLVFKAGCFLYSQTSWGKAALCPEALSRKPVVNERRRYPRVAVQGAFADVAGHCESCSAMVDNISKFGVGLKNIPDELMNEAEKFKVTVNTQAGNFEMLVDPRWNKLQETGHRVGVEIQGAPRRA